MKKHIKNKVFGHLFATENLVSYYKKFNRLQRFNTRLTTSLGFFTI